MDNIDFLTPLNADFSVWEDDKVSDKLGTVIPKYVTGKIFPNLNDVDIVILGVEEDRNSNNLGCAEASNFFRKYFYELYSHSSNIKIADIGNIKQGADINDTYFALTNVVEELFSKNITPIIIGGSQDLSFAIYKAYVKLNSLINIATIDNKFDLGDANINLNSNNFLSHIVLNKPNILFNYTNIGYQTCLVEQEAIELMDNLYFDIYRLGYFNNNIKIVETLLRNVDFVSFDMSSIRQSEAPGNKNASPNGFYGDDACQICCYAGSGTDISCIGFFELNPKFDNNGQTAHLLAQMVWYFIDGYYKKVKEFPNTNSNDFTRYEAQFSEAREHLTFYKSNKTNRWWMEVKSTESVNPKHHKHYIIPCTEDDYEQVLNGNIPDRWLKAQQKIM